MTQRLVIITEYFYPSERNDAFLLTKIADKLSERNDIRIICTTELENEDELSFIKNKISRLNSLKIKNSNILLRVIKLAFISLKLIFKSLFYLKKNDKVLTVTNPAFLLPLLVLIKKIKKFELTVLVYDVFPDNLTATRILASNSLLFKLLKKVFNWAYLNTDKLIVIGRDMKEVIENKTKKKVPIEIIENWCDYSQVIPTKKESNPIIRKFNLENKIVFSFVGNFGLVQGIENLLKASSLVKNKDFVLLFIGNGSETQKIETFVEESSDSNVIYAGEYPSKDRNLFLNACDISLISLNDSMYGLGVPSKSYYNMAAQKPLLYIGHKKSEIAQLINEHEIGWNCESSNPKELATLIDHICDNKDLFYSMGKKSRKILIEKYSEKIILEKYNKLYPGEAI